MSLMSIAHAIANTENTILQQCIKVEKKGLYSNQNRAKKYETNTTIELPKNFLEKDVMCQARIKASLMKNALSITREHSYMNKPQLGAYVQLLEESDADLKMSMTWLKKCYLDPHTESYICGAQELALITRYHEKHILKNGDDDRCVKNMGKPYSIFWVRATH